jgi:hypothetical protein
MIMVRTDHPCLRMGRHTRCLMSAPSCAARRACRQCSQYLQGMWTGIYSAATVQLPCDTIMRLQDVHTESVVNTCKACGHASTVRLQYGYSVTPSLWTTRLAPLQCQVTRQHNATLLIECSVAGDKTRCAHTIEDIICYS